MAFLEIELPLDYEEEVFVQLHLTVEKGLEIQLGHEDEGVVQTRILIRKTGRKIIAHIWPEGKNIEDEREAQEMSLLRLSGKSKG